MKYFAGFFAVIFSTQALSADDAALRSCGPSDGQHDGPPYVTLDSPGYQSVEAALDKLSAGATADDLIAVAAVGDFLQMSLYDVIIPASAVICSYDMFEATGCKGMLFLPSPVEHAAMVGDALNFTASFPENGTVVQYEFSSPAFENAVITTTQDNEVSVNSWTRSPDGTEAFRVTSTTGAVSSYTEYPDCSGMGNTVRYNEAGLLATNDFTWSSASGTGFTFQFEVCRFQEPNIGCDKGRL